MARVARLEARDQAEIVSVFCDAFRDYPVMRYVVGPGHADFDARLRELVNYFVLRRVRQGAPLFGVFDRGDLVAAATMTLPGEPEMPPDVLAHRDALFRSLGDDARERYQTYANAATTFTDSRPHHHLNMIGVRRVHTGRGLARPLLEEAVRLSDADPASAGVSLTTETAKNLTLYEHFGYRVVGHARVSPELESWGLFRERTTQHR